MEYYPLHTAEYATAILSSDWLYFSRHGIKYISMYKLGDVGISSNLIGSLSLTNGQCPPPGRWIMKQWPAGVSSRFAEVTENDILRMQDIEDITRFQESNTSSVYLTHDYVLGL